MRKILAVFLTVCLLTSSPAAWADYWNEGNNGTTEDDAYLIDSIDDLKALRNRVNAGTEPDDRYYRLEIDMNLTEMTGWEPIGTSSGGHYFKGHFNGNGKSIHVNINGNRGLFGDVKTEADTYAVKNLTVNGKVAGRGAAGIVYSLHSGIIDNCTFTGTLCRFCNTVYVNSNVGGIVQHMADGKITKCTVNATITDLRGNDYGGGIVGIMNAGTVKDNSAYITLSGTSFVVSHIGGVIGKIESATSATITISGNEYSGATYGIGCDAGGFSSNEGCIDASEKVAIKTTSLKAGVIKTAYSVTIERTGGVSPCTWTISKGTLPAGLTLNKTTGKLSGKPKKAGTFSFTVKVTDKNKKTATKAFTLKITQPSISGTLNDGIMKVSYSGTLKATGGTSAYMWTISSGKLPTGLSLGKTNGKITGKPTATGTFKFTVKVTDKNKVTATKAYTVKVTKTAMSGSLTTGTIEGYSYYGNLTVSGGTAAYKWTISKGKLPTGLKFTYSGTTATISGTPTKAGSFSFTVKVTDKNSVAATKAFSVYVVSKSLIQTATKNVKSASATVKATSSNKKTSQSLTAAVPNIMTNNPSNSQGNGTITLAATLNVASDDVIETYGGKDSDLVKVKANTELTFIIGEWGVDVSELTVYVDDKPVEGLTVEEGKFTLTTEMVHGDFKVSVKAQSDGVELESEEVYIISE